MKNILNMKYKKWHLAFMLSFFAFSFQGCDNDLNVENINEPDVDRVLNTKEAIITLLNDTSSAYFSSLITSRNSYYDYIADQFTSCSLSSPWPLNREPRERISNEVGDTFESTIKRDWYAAYKAITNCNDILPKVEEWGAEDEDYNKTKAATLALKGIAMGYVGLIYKEGVILDKALTDSEVVVFSDYNTVVNKAIEYIEEAKAIYTSNSSVKWDYLPEVNLSSSTFIQVLNTYAAKFLIGKARTKSEFEALDFTKIKSYLDGAIQETFTSPNSRELYNSYQYFTSRQRRGRYSYCNDQKIPWLLSQRVAPKKKGKDDEPEITSPDKRTELYYVYSEQSKFYYYERDPTLYSNYALKRYKRKDRYEGETNFLMMEEVELLKAEVAYGMKDYALAEQILNTSNRTRVGELPELTGANKDEIADALFYENSIELHVAGKAINWMFMRRFNLLQEGTMLHFPVPGIEAYLSGKEVESFGGKNTGDGINVADGSNAWR